MILLQQMLHYDFGIKVMKIIFNFLIQHIMLIPNQTKRHRHEDNRDLSERYTKLISFYFHP